MEFHQLDVGSPATLSQLTIGLPEFYWEPSSRLDAGRDEAVQRVWFKG